MDKYAEYLPQIGPLKKFKNKKLMWAEISNDLKENCNNSKTALQIENRYKTVLNRKKKAVENNNKSGSSREEVPFEKELSQMSKLDDSIEPEVLRSANSVKYPKQPLRDINKLSTSSDTIEAIGYTPPKKKSKSLEDRKIELFELKMEAKERRHKEKLNLLRELFSKD